MKPSAFGYVAARDLDHALAVPVREGGDVKVVAAEMPMTALLLNAEIEIASANGGRFTERQRSVCVAQGDRNGRGVGFGIDPAWMRRRDLITAPEFPYRAASGLIWDRSDEAASVRGFP